MPDEEFDLSQAITLIQAAALLRGRKGRRPHVTSVRRWCNPRRGYNGSGAKIVLRCVRVGGELLTTAEWVAEFERLRARAGVREPFELGVRSPAKFARDVRRANERLDELLAKRT